MDREALMAMLVSRYGDIATEAGMTLVDEAAGFGPILDRVTGWAADPDLNAVWLEPLARFATLDYLADRLSGQIDVTSEGDSYRINQLFTNVRALLADAKAAVAWFVDPVAPGTNSGEVVLASPYAIIVPGPTW